MSGVVWREATLSEVAQIERETVSPNAIHSSDTFIGLEHINGDGNIDESNLAANSDIASTKFRFTDQHILYGKLRPYLKKIALPKSHGICSTDILPLLPNFGTIEKRYLFHYLRQPYMIDLATSRSAGANLPRISPSILADFPVRFPPLDEQRRIAAILDKADAIRRKRQQALALADDFLRSAFLEMFGDLRRNSKGWPTASISDICEQIVDCVNRTAPAVEGPTPFKMLRTTNIRNGVIHLDPVKYVDQETFGRWNRRLPPRQGDVILTREAPVGEVGLVNFDDFVFLGQRLMLYRADPSIVTPAYLLHMFLDLYLKAQFDRGGMGSTVKHLPLPVCRSFEVRVPPLNLQQRFSALKQCQSKILLSLTKKFGDANTLFASLSQRAFRGEL